ncbi:helix-turn-helix domain-containing protein [Bacillus sp. APMAM]|nr:helix-turn-helix domain-containing protein [Bacillus sp. APMAM]RTZ54208.1 XRE family transcriptional regulator [Bacillus sp. SAJ1]
MLNSQLIGSYISRLRKEKDFTQMDLANSLNVSHQAVSKWERGESLPDLGTLVELASMFEITVDNLLSGGKKDAEEAKKEPFIKNIIEGHPKHAAHFMNTRTIHINELVDMAPLMKASSLEELTSNVDEDVFSIQHLVELAPFLTEANLNELIKKLNPNGLSISELSHFAPFISNELLVELANITEITDFKELVHFAPFLDEEIISLLERVPNEKIDWNDIVHLAPYLERDAIIRLVTKKSEGKLTVKQISMIAPFLDGDMRTLLDYLSLEELEVNDITDLLPFLEKDSRVDLVKRVTKVNLTVNQIATIAPFLEEDELEQMLGEENLKITPKNLAALAPFLTQKALVRLVENFSRNYESK